MLKAYRIFSALLNLGIYILDRFYSTKFGLNKPALDQRVRQRDEISIVYKSDYVDVEIDRETDRHNCADQT